MIPHSRASAHPPRALGRKSLLHSSSVREVPRSPQVRSPILCDVCGSRRLEKIRKCDTSSPLCNEDSLLRGRSESKCRMISLFCVR